MTISHEAVTRTDDAHETYDIRLGIGSHPVPLSNS